MSKLPSEKAKRNGERKRRRFTDEFKSEAVHMLLDGHAAVSICERLGLSGPNLLYRWRRELVRSGGATAVGLEVRVREPQAELRRVERERDVLKKLRQESLGLQDVSSHHELKPIAGTE